MRSFGGSAGASPHCELVEDANGRLYGTTIRGGHADAGTIFTLLAEPEPLAFTITQQPAHGTLSGTAPDLVYTPDANYNGPDSFWFKVNDGTADSFLTAIIIAVVPVNDPPVAESQALETFDNASLAITLAGSDVETAALSFRIVSGSAHGTLSGTAPNVVYTPPFPYAGNDNFTFEVEDADGAVAVATVDITILASDRPPVAVAGVDQNVVTTSDCVATVTVDGGGSSDPDGDSLSYSWQLFQNGALLDSVPNEAVVSWSMPSGTYEAVLTVSTTVNGQTISANDQALITVVPSAPVLTAIDPVALYAGGSGFTLSVSGGCFQQGATVYWNGSARSTTVVNSGQLDAIISAEDLNTTEPVSTVLVEVLNGDGQLSNPLGFGIVAQSVGVLDTSVAVPGGTTLVSTAPTTEGDPGVTVEVQNNGGDPLIVIAATYDTKPVGETAFRIDNGDYVDVQITGADSDDVAIVDFYYPSTITGKQENKIKLRYFDGANWITVLSSSGTSPTKNTTDNLDGTVSGGRFTVVIDNTSTPKITELNGTVFGMFDASPQINTINGPTGPVSLGASTEISVDYITLGDPAAVEVSVLWNDASESTVSPLEEGFAVATKLYTAAGVYGLTIFVTDDDGNTTEEPFEYVVVFDPNGGFVTGGGWIMSPAGAFVPDSTLVGKANFGFVSKYKKGANVPTGNTEFQFKAGELNFSSTAYQWLVVAGSKAQYKGVGTINGWDGYGFLLSATDGDAKNHGDGVDKFRIKIWDTGSGDIVYDNKLGASDDIDMADPQEIGGGSIVIHSAK